MLKLDKSIKSVCTHSSGNHAMAVAYIGKQFGLTTYIVMPENSAVFKRKCVESYGANIIISGNTIEER
jgi:threonine dehydratase